LLCWQLPAVAATVSVLPLAHPHLFTPGHITSPHFTDLTHPEVLNNTANSLAWSLPAVQQQQQQTTPQQQQQQLHCNAASPSIPTRQAQAPRAAAGVRILASAQLWPAICAAGGLAGAEQQGISRCR
jgi:hypothetical protein